MFGGASALSGSMPASRRLPIGVASTKLYLDGRSAVGAGAAPGGFPRTVIKNHRPAPGDEGAHGVQPARALAALAVSAAMVSGLVLSSPAVRQAIRHPFIVENIPLAEPTPEPVSDTKPLVRTKIQPTPYPKPVETTPPPIASDDPPFMTLPIPGPAEGTGGDPLTILPQPTPTPTPVLTGATMDPRYARDFQPPYPPAEERAGREGLVAVRVLVGSDGRVRRIERVAAASDAFWAATERQALARWRFRPATRDGVAIEAWRELTVRFVMPE